MCYGKFRSSNSVGVPVGLVIQQQHPIGVLTLANHATTLGGGGGRCEAGRRAVARGGGGRGRGDGGGRTGGSADPEIDLSLLRDGPQERSTVYGAAALVGVQLVGACGIVVVGRRRVAGVALVRHRGQLIGGLDLKGLFRFILFYFFARQNLPTPKLRESRVCLASGGVVPARPTFGSKSINCRVIILVGSSVMLSISS